MKKSPDLNAQLNQGFFYTKVHPATKAINCAQMMAP